MSFARNLHSSVTPERGEPIAQPTPDIANHKNKPLRNRRGLFHFNLLQVRAVKSKLPFRRSGGFLSPLHLHHHHHYKFLLHHTLHYLLSVH